MCNDNLNLVELLGNCPKGTKLYSPLLGELTLKNIIPLDKFTVTEEGVVKFKKEDNYGTYNR